MNQKELLQLIIKKDDLSIIDNILTNKLNNNTYLYTNNKLSYVSLFNDSIVENKLNLINLERLDELKEQLFSVIKDTLVDTKEFFNKEINLSNISVNYLVNHYVDFINNNKYQDSLIKSTIAYYFELIKILNANNQISFILAINIINNILMFYGYYLDWHKKYKNSAIGFWSQFYQLIIEIQQDKIEDKFINNYLEHLNLNIMDPIYFDNNKDNKNIEIKNINIFVAENNFAFDKKILLDEYNNKIKKIDRLLLSIYKEMEFEN